MPKVSLIIPVYNVSEYIERCMHSVMAQTYTDIECIIIDDCGTDDSMAKCEQMIREYEGPIKFLILHHEHNRGLSAARNTGIHQAIGKWFYFLDSDDEITPHCIETLLKVGEEDEAIEMVQGSTRFRPFQEKDPYDLSWQQLPSSMKDSETIKYWFFHKRKMRPAAWNKLLKRSFIMEHQLFFKDGLLFEDTLWTYYLLNCLNETRIVTETTHYYYSCPGSICTGTDIKIQAQNKGIVLYEILTNLPHGIERDVLRRYIDFFFYPGVSCVRSVFEYKSAFSLYWELARKYRCRSVQTDLALAYISSYFKNSDKVFKRLRIQSRRVARLKYRVM